MGQCLDIPEVATETIVLSLDLIGFSPGNTADIGRGLRKKQAEEAIQKALKNENKELTKLFLKGKPITSEKAQESVTDMGKAVASAIADSAQRKLKQQLGCAWKRSPVGIWVDENDWVLYIVVPLVIGGAAAGAGYMYHARVGDKPAGIQTSLAEPHLKVKPIGSLTLGLSDIKFVPSERIVETKVFSKIEWKPLNIGFSIFGGAKDGELSKLKLQSKIAYKGSGATSNLSLGLNTFLELDSEKGYSHGAGANASYDFRLFGGPMRFGAEGSLKQQIDFQGGRKLEGTVLFTLGKPF